MIGRAPGSGTQWGPDWLSQPAMKTGAETFRWAGDPHAGHAIASSRSENFRIASNTDPQAGHE